MKIRSALQYQQRKPSSQPTPPPVFGSVASVQSKNSEYPQQSQQRTHGETIGSEGGEELVDLEKALNIRKPKRTMSSTITSVRCGGESRESDDDNKFIKITKVVEVSDK